MSSTLNKRNRDILKTIVQIYLFMAEPVGSRAVSKRYKAGLSPATIRNVMADLEEMGYLTQPHTSAGRLPTDKGYRYYVDSLMDKIVLSSREEDQIKKGCLSKGSVIDNLMESTSIVLSQISHQAGLVMLPKLTHAVLNHIYFVKVSSRQLLAVFISKTGLVQNKIIDVNEEFSQEKLDEISRYLNEEFAGLTLEDIRKTMIKKMASERAKYDRLYKRAVNLVKKTFREKGTSANVYIGGASNIVNQPEFKDDIQKMRSILETLEDKDRLLKILDKCISQECMNIIIGSESQLDALQDCSIITRRYDCSDGTSGVLGIVGSKRMEYPRIVAIVDYTAKLMSLINEPIN